MNAQHRQACCTNQAAHHPTCNRRHAATTHLTTVEQLLSLTARPFLELIPSFALVYSSLLYYSSWHILYGNEVFSCGCATDSHTSPAIILKHIFQRLVVLCLLCNLRPRSNTLMPLGHIMLELHTIASITTSAIALEKLVKKNAPITAGLDISPPGSVAMEHNTTHPTTPTTPPINTYGFLLIPVTSRLISTPRNTHRPVNVKPGMG